MRTRIVRGVICVLGAAAGVAHAGPAGRGHDAQQAALAKSAAKIAQACGNAALTYQVDWPAFEKLDYQVLVAGPEPNRAANAQYVAATRDIVLTGESDHSGTGTSIAVRGAGVAEAFQLACRDHQDLRAHAAKVTTIVLEPVADLPYLAERDAIATARKTGDWTAVGRAFDRDTKANDARTYRMRYALKGATVTVTFNVLVTSGGAGDYVEILQAVFDVTPRTEVPRLDGHSLDDDMDRPPPKPSKPAKPSKVAAPAKPDKPDKPAKPDKPDKPSAPPPPPKHEEPPDPCKGLPNYKAESGKTYPADSVVRADSHYGSTWHVYKCERMTGCSGSDRDPLAGNGWYENAQCAAGWDYYESHD